MKIIAHRGNLNGPNPFTENHPDQIDLCISKGYDVEIDLWYLHGEYFLGHNSGMDKISIEYLLNRKDYLWVHCKNQQALFQLIDTDLNYFWHQEDDVTITSKRFIWAYPKKQKVFDKSLVILDFSKNINLDYYKALGIYAVCVDYINL